MYRLTALFGFVLLSVHAGSQSLAIDSGAYHQAVKTYHQTRGPESALFNGVKHLGYSQLIEGHGYFRSVDWVKGEVLYDGILYSGVPLKYDVVSDELIVQHPDGFNSIGVVNQRVSDFFLNGHRFIRIVGHPTLSDGYYDQLSAGKLNLISKRSKIIEENIVGRVVERKFVVTDRFYVFKNGTYSMIRNPNSMFEVFGDKKHQVKMHLRKLEIRFRRTPGLAIETATAYYNQLIK